MSMDTWKAEFYPTAAKDCPEKDAVLHSLTKWKGFRKDNMDKHGVRKDSKLPYLTENMHEQEFRVGVGNCALCLHHYEEEAAYPCSTCPLYHARGGAACDRAKHDEVVSPWTAWSHYNNPEPMIAALEKALEKALEDQE